jgi:dihydroneopterin aldolase
MSGLLASVRSVPEAEIALQGGADIIDLKEPKQGALGAVDAATLRQVVEIIAQRVPVSATIGDLDSDSESIYRAIMLTHESDVELVKVGFFPRLPASLILQPMQRAASQGVRLIAVLFADQPLDMSLLSELQQAGLYGAMLDTAAKGSGSLLTHQSLATLGIFTRRCRELQLLSGLAGSLAVQDIAQLLDLEADYLGFRTALCDQQQRNAGINAGALAQVRLSMPCRQHPTIASVAPAC